MMMQMESDRMRKFRPDAGKTSATLNADVIIEERNQRTRE